MTPNDGEDEFSVSFSDDGGGDDEENHDNQSITKKETQGK